MTIARPAETLAYVSRSRYRISCWWAMIRAMTFTTTVLPIALAGLAVVGTLAGVWLGGRGEHRQWLRTERLRAYSAMYSALQLATATVAEGDGEDEAYGALNGAAGAILLLGPADVVNLVPELVLSAMDIARHGGIPDTPPQAVDRQLHAERRFLIAASSALGGMQSTTNWLAKALQDPGRGQDSNDG